MIRNLLFDLDDTLLDFHAAEKTAIAGTLTAFGLSADDENIARYSAANAAQWRLLEKGLLLRSQVRVRRFEQFLREIGSGLDPAAMAKDYEKRLSRGIDKMPGADALLARLRPDYRLYLVSNGFEPVQTARLRSSGLIRSFDGIFISQRIGYDKPDLRFFEACFAAIPDFSPQETVIIGDGLTSDIQGGIAAGIRTVWFNAAGKRESGEITPDYEIHTLKELPALLSEMTAAAHGCLSSSDSSALPVSS